MNAVTDEAIAPVLRHIDDLEPGLVVGVYLYGSAVSAGLRPDSDIDLLMITARSLTADERIELIGCLLQTSGWAGHGQRFADAADRRPIELTSLTAAAARDVDRRDQVDFQYGEWLRSEFVDGVLAEPHTDPDGVILQATALSASRILRGPELAELMDPVNRSHLKAAVQAIVPALLDDLVGDERNVLLGLARAVVTAQSGRIVSKTEAARIVAPLLTSQHRSLLEQARAAYVGGRQIDWSVQAEQVQSLANALENEVQNMLDGRK